MQRAATLILLATGSVFLGGCVAGMAANAVGMAVRGAGGTPESNAPLAPIARQLCSERAARYGTVKVIDVQQANATRIIVWGTVTAGMVRQSFECRFGTAITSFKLRPVIAGR